MHRFVIAVSAASLLLFAASCRQPIVRGSGKELSQPRVTSGYFDKIEIDAPLDATINVVAGTAPSLNLTGYENILSYIETRVEDSTLHISMKEEDVHFYLKKNIIAIINLPSLRSLDVSGSSDATIKGNITGAALNISMSGSGDIKAENVNVADLSVDVSGSSDVSIGSGTTTKATYSIAGSGDISAFGLQTTETSLSISGSSDAQVNVSSKLSIEIAGSGDVRYKGHPAITQAIAGAGDVKDAN